MPSVPDIPDYQIGAGDFLGEGAYGRVWRAVYKGDQERAVKVFKPRAIQEMLFEGEYDKLRQLDEHPGIVTLYDRGRTAANEPYFVMRLLAEKQAGDGRWVGRTLGSRLGNRETSPDASLRWRWTRQVAEAVAFMHEQDIVHCDLKPSNVLLGSGQNPDAVVSDFGQSRSSSLRELPAPGSLAFASPEQLQHPEKSNPRWDVYGFAATTYYLWKERPPRPLRMAAGEEGGVLMTLTEVLGPEQELAQMVNQLRAQPEVDLSSGGADPVMPAGLGELLQRCLSLDPEQRPLNMGEVLAELDAIDARRKSGVPKWLLATLGVALAATLVVGGLMLSKHREQLERDKEQQRLAAIEATKDDLREQLANASRDGDAAALHELALRLLDYQPDNADLWAARLEGLAGMGQWVRLREKFSQAPEAVLANPVLLPVRARMEAAAENFSAERALWAELAGRTDVDADLRREGFRDWGWGLRREKQWSQLNDVASDWLTWEAVIEPLLLRVEASLNLRQFAKARVDLNAARDLDATNEEVREETPRVERGERLAEEMTALDAAVAAAKRDPQPLMDRALACLRAGFGGLAIPDLEAAQRLAPGSTAVRILTEIAHYLNTGKQVDDSLVRIDGDRWNTYDMQHLESFATDAPLLADLLAMELAQEGVPPTDAGVDQRVRMLTELGQHSLAIELARSRAMRDGATTESWTTFLTAYFRGERWPQGEQMAVEATDRFSEDNGMWFLLGAFRARQADHRGAVEAFDQSLELFDDAIVREWRATSLQQLGEQ